MSQSWSHLSNVTDHLGDLRFVASSAGLVIGLVVAVEVEEAARATAALIRRSLRRIR